MAEETAWDEFERYLVIVAHPDDAEFSSGGTIAHLTKHGRRVDILQVTSGAKGTDDPSIHPEDLARTRESEETESGRRLGVSKVEFLRCMDSELEPDLGLREKVVRAIRTFKPDVIITHDPYRPYALHPDHRAVGFAAMDAVYPIARDPHNFPEHLREGLEPHKTGEIWFFNAENPDLYVDITDSFDTKLEALRAHESQVGDGSESFPRVRERAAEVAREQPFELAEAFKVVQMRR